MGVSGLGLQVFGSGFRVLGMCLLRLPPPSTAAARHPPPPVPTPHLGGPLDPRRDALHPLAVGRLQSHLHLGPVGLFVLPVGWWRLGGGGRPSPSSRGNPSAITRPPPVATAPKKTPGEAGILLRRARDGGCCRGRGRGALLAGARPAARGGAERCNESRAATKTKILEA